MKISNRKKLDIFGLVLLSILAIGALFYLINDGSNYGTLKRQKDAVESVVSLQNFLLAVENERQSASLLLILPESSTLQEKSKEDKVAFQKAFETLKALSKNDLSKTFRENLSLLQNSSKVDTNISVDFEKRLLSHYSQALDSVVMNEITRIIGENNATQPYFNTLFDLIALQTNSDIEGGFVSSYIAANRSIGNEGFAVWNQLIGDDYLPIIDNKKISLSHYQEMVELLNQNRQNIKVANALRSKIILASAHQQMEMIDRTLWHNAFEQKIAALQEMSKLLVSDLMLILDEEIESSKQDLVLLAVALLILIAQVVTLVFRLRSSQIDEESFSEAIEDIRLNLDERQTVELDRIIKKQDKTRLYSFMADTIAKSSRSKDLFLANMSHEIRTPLNGILGFTQLVKKTKLTQEQMEFVEIIDKSSNNLLMLLNDILDFSKIQESQVELEKIEFNPFEIFESAIELYTAKANEKYIRLELFVDPAINKRLEGDPTKLTQIVVNLISNAIKFTPEEGIVELRVDKVNSENGIATIKFSVKDTGIGVNEEQKANIFKAFSQEDVSTRRKFGGTGLGLSISKRFTEAMGGELDIQSVKGHGATFFFTLKFPELSTIETKHRHYQVAVCLSNEESCKSHNEIFKRYLLHLGVVYMAYNSINALLGSGGLERFDVVFIDGIDPDEIKKIPESQTKIIYISALSEQKNRIPRVDSFLYLPVTLSKIQRIIDSTMQANDVQKTEEQKTIGFKNLTVLVAEDNVINQKLLVHTLGKMKIAPMVASNGKEAFELYQKELFDIVFMDVQMPVMDGIEATEAILRYEKENNLSHVPIIALTAETMKGDKERFTGLGMDGYLPKPIDLNIFQKFLVDTFPEKIVETNVAKDIILFKQNAIQRNIYEALFKEMGHSIDVVSNLSEYIAKIAEVQYIYSFADGSLFEENPNLASSLITKGIKNILFIDDAFSNRAVTYFEEFDAVIPNIANRSLLAYYIEKI